MPDLYDQLSAAFRKGHSRDIPDLLSDAHFADGRATPAAVLIAVTERDEPGVLLTQRPNGMRDHPGQVAFPGGKLDAGEDAVTAAWREAEEERAVPRDAARQAMTDGLAIAFGIGAEAHGLTTPLNYEEQEAREALQMAAHCDALPEHILPAIVDIQRLRDAQLAKMVARAFELTGGPVVVITGNGHARTDWGILIYVKRAAPDLSILSLGQRSSITLITSAPSTLQKSLELAGRCRIRSPTKMLSKSSTATTTTSTWWATWMAGREPNSRMPCVIPGKGVRNLSPERPGGCFAQKVPNSFSLQSLT